MVAGLAHLTLQGGMSSMDRSSCRDATGLAAEVREAAMLAYPRGSMRLPPSPAREAGGQRFPPCVRTTSRTLWRQRISGTFRSDPLSSKITAGLIEVLVGRANRPTRLRAAGTGLRTPRSPVPGRRHPAQLRERPVPEPPPPEGPHRNPSP